MIPPVSKRKIGNEEKIYKQCGIDYSSVINNESALENLF